MAPRSVGLFPYRLRTPSGCHIGKREKPSRRLRTPSGCHIGKREMIPYRLRTPSGCSVGRNG
ncbi:MAG: hypothetical protein IKM85_08425 [Bacteroidales bacterium]|nr:hypothetical protein [Bacteroidales bacterium]